jgi:hypothetical protein
MKRAVIALLLLCVVSSAFAAKPGESTPIERGKFVQRTTVIWTPEIDYAGNSVVRLTLSHSQTSLMAGYEALVIVARPSGRVVAVVVDPSVSLDGEPTRVSEAVGRAALTVRAELAAFADELVVPFAAGKDEVLSFYLFRGKERLALTNVRADLSQRFHFTVRSRPVAEDPIATGGVLGSVRAMQGRTIERCMASDWCVEQCVDCDQNATVDFWNCTIECPPPPSEDESCFYGDEPGCG